MRYLILSDTHGNVRDASRVIEHWSQFIDGVWHLGDNARDLIFLEREYFPSLQLTFCGINGNCDMPSSIPYKRLFDLEGRRVLMCHGHLYHVGSGLGYIQQKAFDMQANVVLFGHTHIPLCREEKGILFLNPGSLTSPRGGSAKSYALLEIENGRAAATLMNYSDII